MNAFVYKVCYSQTDRPNYLVHALSKLDADQKMAKVISETGAHHFDYVCAIHGEVK
jgi:hypothetical protein